MYNKKQVTGKARRRGEKEGMGGETEREKTYFYV